VKETNNIYFGDQQARSEDTNTKSCYLIPTLTKAHNVLKHRGESEKEKDIQIKERTVRNKTVGYWGDLQQTVIKWQ